MDYVKRVPPTPPSKRIAQARKQVSNLYKDLTTATDLGATMVDPEVVKSKLWAIRFELDDLEDLDRRAPKPIY